jgi:hypothetical protein
MAEKEIEAIGFDHNSINYVIKVFQVGFKYIVEPYLNGRKASIYSYSVEVDSTNREDWENLHGSKLPYARLIEIVKTDIQESNGMKKEIVS